VYLEDVVGNTETVERLKIIAQDGNMPHIIISVSLAAVFERVEQPYSRLFALFIL
jgi:DNA polymerase III delta prime subunit